MWDWFGVEINQLFDFYVPTPQEEVSRLKLDGIIERAIKLLKENEPEDGYYLAFSGGKDSCVTKWLAIKSGVKYEAFYNQTTIDPPELIKFIKTHHQDVKWNIPAQNMMHMVANSLKLPPTRKVRWCCEVYKEHGGNGRTKIIGVRAAESSGRIKWGEIGRDNDNNKCICPIIFWSDEQLWDCIKTNNIPYCELYDQGFTRLGCVGCPLNPKGQKVEFEKWPRFKENWKRAIIKNWENNKDVPRKRDGNPRFQAKFKSGEELWEWWLNQKTPDYIREECQSGIIMTNHPIEE